MPGSPDREAARLLAVMSLRVDDLLGGVAPALASAGVDWILLKGAVIRQRLYPDAERHYRDLDLLVDPWHEQLAYDQLRRLGFLPEAGYGEPERIALMHEWRRGEDLVEVHVTLNGADADPAHVWSELSRRRRTITIARQTVFALDDSGMALHLALHATQHGIKMRKGVEDLRRGAAMLPADAWQDAARLAIELDAAPAFAAGLQLLPPADRPSTPIPDALTAEALLKAASAHPVALGFARSSRASGGWGVVRQLPRLALPSRAYLSRWSRTYLQRRLPYPVAYVWRMAHLARHGVPALMAWRAAEGTVRRSSGHDPASRS